MKYVRPTVVALLITGVLCANALALTKTELRTYYNEQKKALMDEFVAPETGSEIELTMKNGKVKKGIVSSLNRQMLTLQSGVEFKTIHKAELSDESRQLLFAVDYADALAKEKTLAYKLDATASKAKTPKKKAVKHMGMVSVKEKTERGKEPKFKDSKETENAKGVVTTRSVVAKTTTETHSLTMTISNRASFEDTYTLEWYFLKESVQKSESSGGNSKKGKSKPKPKRDKSSVPTVGCYERGSKEFTVKPNGKVVHQVVAPQLKLVNVEDLTEKSRGDDSVSEKESGDEVAGYVVLLKCGDEIVDKKTTDAIKYLDSYFLRKIEKEPLAEMTKAPPIPKIK